MTAGTSNAGLPMRVPMAQLPGDAAAPPAGVEPPVKMNHEPDPTAVSSLLAKFYDGINRATAEEES